MSKVIGIDVDDVVADLITEWLNRYNAENGTTWTPADLTQWELQNDLGCSGNAIFKHLTPDIYDKVQPYEGAAEAVSDIKDLGYGVAFVTNCRDNATFLRKLDWLKQHGFEYDSVYGCHAGAMYENKNDCPVDWLIDDHIGNLEAFTRGYPVLVTRPHNRNLIWQGKRIKHLRDIIPMLKYIAQEDALSFVPPSLPGPTTDLGSETIRAIHDVASGTVSNNPMPAVRQFTTGATRDTDNGKLDYEAFFSPAVLKRRAEFMHKNRFQADGSLRDGDNWQKGIPTDAYMKSLARHFMTVWLAHRSGKPLPQEELCAIAFNTEGLLYEDLKANPQQTP